jgi:hypothetical protein
MRMLSILAGIAAMLVGILLAQSDSDYQGWMKGVIAPTNQSLQKNIACQGCRGGCGGRQEAARHIQAGGRVLAKAQRSGCGEFCQAGPDGG